MMGWRVGYVSTGGLAKLEGRAATMQCSCDSGPHLTLSNVNGVVGWRIEYVSSARLAGPEGVRPVLIAPSFTRCFPRGEGTIRGWLLGVLHMV